MTDQQTKSLKLAPAGARPPSYKVRIASLMADFEMVLRTVDITQQGLTDRELFKAAAKTFDVLLADWQRSEARQAGASKLAPSEPEQPQ